MLYTQFVSEKKENWFSSLIKVKRTNGVMPYFYVLLSSYVLSGRRWRGSLRACWIFAYFTSLLTLLFAAHPT